MSHARPAKQSLASSAFPSRSLGTRENIEWPGDDPNKGTRCRHYVVATAPGHAFASRYVSSEAAGQPVVLSLSDQPASLTGTVRDSAGNPVDGAIAYVNVVHGHPLVDVGSSVTDAEGRYEINGLPSWHPGADGGRKLANGLVLGNARMVFHVQHPDFGTTMAYYESTPQTVDITLNPPAVIQGTVLDFVEGGPLPGVLVNAQGIKDSHWAEVRTNADGVYRLVLPPGQYDVWATYPGRMPIALDSVDARAGETLGGQHIRMTQGGYVSGKLLTKSGQVPVYPNGQPLRIGHYGPARPKSGAAVTSTIVNPDGTYRLHVAPGRNYVYIMTASLSNAVNLDVEDGQKVSHDFVVPDNWMDLVNGIRR